MLLYAPDERHDADHHPGEGADLVGDAGGDLAVAVRAGHDHGRLAELHGRHHGRHRRRDDGRRVPHAVLRLT